MSFAFQYAIVNVPWPFVEHQEHQEHQEQQEQPTTERRTQNVDSSTRRDTCQLRRGEIVPINPDTESPRTHRMPVEMQRRPERSNDVISTKHHEAIKMDILNNIL